MGRAFPGAVDFAEAKGIANLIHLIERSEWLWLSDRHFGRITMPEVESIRSGKAI